MTRVHLLVLLALATTLAGCESCDPSSFSELRLGVRAAPGQLVLRGFVDAPLEAEVILTATGGAHVIIEEARAEDGSGPAEIALELDGDGISPGGERTLAITLTPSGELGLVTARIVIETDAGDLEVPLTAEIRPVPDCEDHNPCTEDSFDRAALVCVNEAVANETPCDDGSACTENDVCAAGRCLGEAVVCEDDADCTADTCDPTRGCVFVPRHSECSDGDPCTEDVCGLGGCENPASPPGTVCALNGCESMGFCALGECVETPVPDGAPCEDGDICTAGDTCQAGECVAGDRAEIGAERPRGIQIGTVVGEACLFALDPIDGCIASYDPGIDEVLAARIDGEAIEIAWRGRFLNEFGAPCDAASQLYVFARNLDTPQEDEAGAPPPEPQPAPYCAAAVFKSRRDLHGVTTEQVSAFRGAGVGSFSGSTLHLAHLDVSKSGVWHERIDALGTRLFDRVDLAELAPLGALTLAVDGDEAALLVAPLRRTDDASRTLEPEDSYVVPLAFAHLVPDAAPVIGRSEMPEVIPALCASDADSTPLRDLEVELQLELDDGLLNALVRARHDGCGDALDFAGPRPPRRLFHRVLDPGLGFAQRLSLISAGDEIDVTRAELRGDSVTLVVDDPVEPQPYIVLRSLSDDGPPIPYGVAPGAPQAFVFEIDGETRFGLIHDGISTELRWRDGGLIEQRVSELASFHLDPERPFRRAGDATVVVGTGHYRVPCSCPPDVDCDCNLIDDDALQLEPVAAVAAFGCLMDNGTDIEPCATHLDCAAGQTCNTDDVCLPPPGCDEGGCEPVCYGACEG